MLYVYIGSKTENKDEDVGLTVFQIKEDGSFNKIQEIKDGINHSYQCIDKKGGFLYSAHGDSKELSSYKINDDGKISFLNKVEINGDNPVYISLNEEDRLIVTSAFNNGTVSLMEVKEDGQLGEILHEIVIPGKEEGSTSNAHQCYWDKKGNYLFVPTQNRCQGIGQIVIFKLDKKEKKLIRVGSYLSRAFDEPRHVVISDDNRFLYLCNEKGNTVLTFEFNEEFGTLNPVEYLPTLPSTYTGRNKTSAIDIDPSGNFLTVSNRYHDSIALFKILKEEKEGRLKFIDTFDLKGEIPRFAGFNPYNGMYYAACLNSNLFVEMKLIPQKEIMTEVQTIEVKKPYCITFYEN